MNKNNGQQLKSTIRNAALLLMVIIVGLGWYMNHNSPAVEQALERKSTEEKGKLVLHTEPELTIKMGDIINIDFQGTLDGEDVGSTEKADVSVGGGKLNEEFENQLVGHHPGDHFTIKVPMSNRLTVKRKYRGKIADVEVWINGVYVRE